MKACVRLLLLAVLSLISFPYTAHAVFSYSWGRAYGDALDQVVTAIAVDNQGNVIMTGSFKGAMDFGGGAIQYSGPDEGAFLAKIGPGGQHIFSLALDDSLDRATNRLGTDYLGDVYLANDFRGSVDLGGGPLVAEGFRDGVIARFDGQGNHVWSQRFGGPGAQVFVEAAHTGVSGQTAVAGTFTGTVNFGGLTRTANPFATNMYVVMYDHNGDITWARYNDGGLVLITSVAVDVQGCTIIAGYHSGTIDLGGGDLTTSGYNVFLVKYNANGGHMWSKTLGADGTFEYAYDVATDVLGNIAVTGHFSQPFDLGGGPLMSSGGWDMYVAKFDPNGDHLWSRAFGDGTEQRAYTVAMDGLGELIVGGYFFGSVDFGGLPLSGDPVDYCVARFDANGNHLWSQRFDVHNIGLPTNKPYAISTGANFTGRMAFVGSFKDAVDLGGGTLTGAGGWDVFVTAFGGFPTGIPDADVTDGRLRAYPNPFNPRTTITYSALQPGPVQLQLYDVRGRLVRVLHDGWKPAGDYVASWDARDDRGEPVASGVYFIRFISAGKIQTHRVVLLK